MVVILISFFQLLDLLNILLFSVIILSYVILICINKIRCSVVRFRVTVFEAHLPMLMPIMGFVIGGIISLLLQYLHLRYGTVGPPPLAAASSAPNTSTWPSFLCCRCIHKSLFTPLKETIMSYTRYDPWVYVKLYGRPIPGIHMTRFLYSQVHWCTWRFGVNGVQPSHWFFELCSKNHYPVISVPHYYKLDHIDVMREGVRREIGSLMTNPAPAGMSPADMRTRLFHLFTLGITLEVLEARLRDHSH